MSASASAAGMTMGERLFDRMDSSNFKLAASLVGSSYIAQGEQAINARRKLVKSLLSQRRLPDTGWDDATIEMFVQDAALMDSNNFPSNVGVGEREARVASRLVARRHWGLAHGIGRSGDITAEQPKAAGSSMLAKLTNLLVADAMRLAGLQDLGPVTVLPLATGMAITVTLLALMASRPAGARYVIWPRIDQKTCLKAVVSAGLEPVVVPMLLEGDQLGTDLAAVQQHIKRLGADAVVAIVSTTSCFAPRSPDRVVELARLAAAAGVGHVINNAYGVQSATLCRAITSAGRKGRVDAFVQSTDKNFMVPVGGAVVAAFARAPALPQAVNAAYPGRASMSPLLDVLLTLLHWGSSGWRAQLQQREQLHAAARARLRCWADQHPGYRLLETPDNPISLALALPAAAQGTADSRADRSTLQREGQAAAGSGQASVTSSRERLAAAGDHGAGEAGRIVQEAERGAPGDGSISSAGLGRQVQNATRLGSMLFARCVSGTRVIARGQQATVAGRHFVGFGAHHDSYPCDYLTVAAAIGTTIEDVELFLKRLTESTALQDKQQHAL